jgi:hypothetical protein
MGQSSRYTTWHNSSHSLSGCVTPIASPTHPKICFLWSESLRHKFTVPRNKTGIRAARHNKSAFLRTKWVMWLGKLCMFNWFRLGGASADVNRVHRYCTSVYFSRVYNKQWAASETQLTVMVLVLVKMAGQFKIIESFRLKPVSHLTVTVIWYWGNCGLRHIWYRKASS